MAIQSVNLDFESISELYTSETHKPLEKVVCLRCGRPLTNEKSHLAHLGPKCARKLAYETRTLSYSSKTLKCYISSFSHDLSSQTHSLPSKQFSLYYKPSSSYKPYCKMGTLSLAASVNKTEDKHGYYKRSFTLPLVEQVVYEIFTPLPEPRIFHVVVQNQQLVDIHYSSKFTMKENY